MLRLWPDFLSTKVWLAFSIDGIAIVQSHAFQKRVLSQQFIKAQSIHESGVDSPAWQALIDQLDEYLAKAVCKKHTQVNVVLSSDFVRYATLPAQQMVMSNAEKSAYAHALFAEIYGVAAQGWQVKYHVTAPNKNTLAVAVDKLLLAAFKQVVVKHQLRLNSVQPYLMMACNALASQISSVSSHLVLLENSKLLLLHLQKGICQQIQVSPYNQDWQPVLNSMLNRELLLNERLDAADKSLLVYAPTQKDQSLNAFNGWKTQRIKSSKNTVLTPPFYMLEAVL